MWQSEGRNILQTFSPDKKISVTPQKRGFVCHVHLVFLSLCSLFPRLRVSVTACYSLTLYIGPNQLPHLWSQRREGPGCGSALSHTSKKVQTQKYARGSPTQQFRVTDVQSFTGRHLWRGLRFSHSTEMKTKTRRFEEAERYRAEGGGTERQPHQTNKSILCCLLSHLKTIHIWKIFSITTSTDM